jgi:Ca2+-binding EF-hand superfamily protein
MRLVRAAFVVVSALFMLSGTAWAQGPATSYDPRAAFAQVDTNKDGQIDIEEFHARLVEVFYNADTNKDGFLTADEYGRLPFSGPFKNADANGDGRISLPEFVTIRFRQFEEADTNHDYQLSVDEVVTAYARGEKP